MRERADTDGAAAGLCSEDRKITGGVGSVSADLCLVTNNAPATTARAISTPSREAKADPMRLQVAGRIVSNLPFASGRGRVMPGDAGATRRTDAGIPDSLNPSSGKADAAFHSVVPVPRSEERRVG